MLQRLKNLARILANAVLTVINPLNWLRAILATLVAIKNAFVAFVLAIIAAVVFVAKSFVAGVRATPAALLAGAKSFVAGVRATPAALLAGVRATPAAIVAAPAAFVNAVKATPAAIRSIPSVVHALYNSLLIKVGLRAAPAPAQTELEIYQEIAQELAVQAQEFAVAHPTVAFGAKVATGFFGMMAAHNAARNVDLRGMAAAAAAAAAATNVTADKVTNVFGMTLDNAQAGAEAVVAMTQRLAGFRPNQ